MAAVFGRAAQRSVVSAARSSARRWHSLGGVERREANAAPRMRSGARRRAHSAFSAPSGPGVGQLRSMTWPRIACAQSLLPLHSATASARLVSRLSTFPELALLDGSLLSTVRLLASGRRYVSYWQHSRSRLANNWMHVQQ